MDSKDNAEENGDKDEEIHPSFKPELNLDTSESAIEYMLYILGQYPLAPSPLPTELISLWATKEVDKSQPCEYCLNQGSKLGFPRVEVDFKKRKIKFVEIQRSCETCYAVIDLKGVLNLIKEAFRDKREEFNLVYEHFLKVNNLKESVNREPKQENKVVFQDLISMAYSLNVLFRMRKSLKTLLNIRKTKLLNYGHFRGTEFIMKNNVELVRNEGMENSMRNQDGEVGMAMVEGRERNMETRNLISNLSLNYTRRVPSRFREVIEKSALDYGDMLSVKNILELTVGMRRCKSLTSTMYQLFIKRITEEIKKNNNINNNGSKEILLETSLELVEYGLLDEKGCQIKEKVGAKGFRDVNNTDYLNSILEFLLDNIEELSRHQVFRLIPIFDEISNGGIKDQGALQVGLASLRGNHLERLTRLVLSYRLFGGCEPGSNAIDLSNVPGGESFNSLYYCNMVVNILKLYAISKEQNEVNKVNEVNNPTRFDVVNEITGIKTEVEENGNGVLEELSEYVEKKVYEVIKENVTKFTSQNIVELVTAIRRVGEPYPEKVIEKIREVYVRHISQYSIKNMIKFMEELGNMNLQSEMVMLNTLLFLPRKISTLDSFESVVKLLEVYRNYESEYLEIFMYQQIHQIYHKINPRYLEKVNKLIES